MAETGLAIYLYGFTLPAINAPEVLGVDDTHAVSTHDYAGLNAIISSVVLADFTGEVGEDNLQNVAWLTPRACRHALVIDTAMRQGSVYPVPFGALFSNLKALEQEMQRRATEVLAILKHIADCEEWGLEATLDNKQAVEALLTEGLQSGQFSLPDSAGRRHLEEQKLRRNLNNDLHDWLSNCLDVLQDELTLIARDTRSRRLSDDKVLHVAYLLRVADVANFQARVADLSYRYQRYGFTFRLTGPWAAYSFCQSAAP